MSDSDIINLALEKVPTGSLVKCDQVALADIGTLRHLSSYALS